MRFFPIVILTFLTGMFGFAAITTKEIEWILAAIGLLIFEVIFLLQEIQSYKLSKGKKIKHRINWGNVMMLYVLSIMTLILAGLLVIDIDNRVHSKQINAVVSEIKHNDDADEDSVETCDAYAKYEVNGKKYVSKYETSSTVCKKKVGSKVKIYYRTDNPKKIVTTKHIILVIFGFIFCAFSLVLVIKKVIRERRA